MDKAPSSFDWEKLLAHAAILRALERMRQLHAEFAGEAGDIMISIVVKLSAPDPYDLTGVDLTEYKGIIPPWNDWGS